MMNSTIQAPAGFNRALALEAAELVQHAYTQYSACQTGAAWSLPTEYASLALFCAKPAGLFAKQEPFGFAARNKTSQNVLIVFRGTESPEDWLSNASVSQTVWRAEWGKVEEGFWKLYQQCSSAVIHAAKLAGEGGSVVVTGHSLGGALATLAAADLLQTGIAASLYSFASPRVGDPAFAAAFHRNVKCAWRMANTEDIVPILPLATPKLAASFPASWLGFALALAGKLEFEHVGTPLCFTEQVGSIAGNHDLQLHRAALAG